MQKYRFKTHLKLVILLFGFSISSLSCQKDDDLSKDTTNSQLEFKRDLITKSQVSKNKKVNSIIQALPKTNTLLTNNFNTQARTVYNEEYDFYINDEKAYHITYGNYDSYTFAIHRSQDNGLVENLILSKQLDGSYKSSIVSYNLNETEKQSIKNGTIPIDIENKMSIQPLSTNAGNRYLSTSTPSIYYDTVTDGCFTPKMNWSDAGELTSIAMTPIGCPEGFIRSIDTGADEGTNAGGVGDDGLFNPNDNPLGNPNTDPSEGGSNTDPSGSPSGGGNGTPNTTGNSNNTGSDNSNGSGQEGSQDCIEVGADGGCIGDVTYPLIPDDELDDELDDDCLPDIDCRPGEIMDEDCECRIDLEDPCANKDLINYEISTDVISMIESRQQPNTMVESSQLVDSFILETINDGWGDVNQDRFSLKIDELPNGYTPFQLFNEIRMNFTNLVVGGDFPIVTDVDLEPYSDEDDFTWNSQNPIGAAMDFNTIFDTSTVVCVEYNEDEMYWIFATVTSYDHQGHFVAGLRQFGLEPNGSGGYSFYVRAADRLGGILDYLANGLSGDEDILFTHAGDQTWKNLMENTVSFIQNQGGQAVEFDETKTYGARHPYDEDNCQD